MRLVVLMHTTEASFFWCFSPDIDTLFFHVNACLTLYYIHSYSSYLVQTIHFFRGVHDSVTSATQRIHVRGMLF